jgi:hypothetical protein
MSKPSFAPVVQVQVNFFSSGILTRVARWYIFKPKIPLWVIFEGFCNAMEDVVSFGLLVYFTATWYILWPFGIFCAVSFELIWYLFSRSGMLYQAKSVNPVPDTCALSS